MSAIEKLRAVKDIADQKRDTASQSNRSLMPKVTEFIDAVRAEFGEVKVSYASENGIEKGRKWPVESDRNGMERAA